MATLSAHGLSARLPAGCEGRIFIRPESGPGIKRPVVHLATFPLPADLSRVGDFGGGIVTLMGSRDIFAVLFEYGPESVGTALFARPGPPWPISSNRFHPYTLRRGLGGHSGTQWFFTEQGRPFTLYAVLGSHTLRSQLVPRLNAMLAGIGIAVPAGTASP